MENKKTTMRNLAIMLRRKSDLAMGGSGLLRKHMDDEIDTYAYGHKGFFALVKLKTGYTGCEFTLLYDHWGSYKGVFAEVPMEYALKNIKECPFLVERVVPSEETFVSKFGKLVGKLVFEKDNKDTEHGWYSRDVIYEIYDKKGSFLVVQVGAWRENQRDRVSERELLSLIATGKRHDVKYNLTKKEFDEGYEWEKIHKQLQSQFLLKEI
jgi:hypothetical protein